MCVRVTCEKLLFCLCAALTDVAVGEQGGKRACVRAVGAGMGSES